MRGVEANDLHFRSAFTNFARIRAFEHERREIYQRQGGTSQ
mgnify:CR=1 FL=1